MSKELIKPYLKHDEDAVSDGKISKMMFSFRKLAAKMSHEDLQSFLPHAAYGIYWQILEFMYSNKFKSETIEILADNMRIPEEYFKPILDNFELFEIIDDEYVSLRLLRDKEKRAEIKTSASENANTRWLLAEFNKAYCEFFDETPVLKNEEIESLKDYSRKIPDLKNKLRDIIYTLKNLKFENKNNFKPCANWLLKDNNLARILNGEFGKLKHKPTEHEIKEAEKQYIEEQKRTSEPSELELRANSITSKDEALELFKEYYSDKTHKPAFVQGKLIIVPYLRKLKEKFDISDSEVLKLRGFENG